MPAPVNPDSAPPDTSTSATVNVVEGSLRVKVIVAVWPDRRAGMLDAIVMVGETVSMEIDGEIAPAVLSFPAASLNVAAATETVPGVVESAAGVKIAEYVDPEPVNPESVPPARVMSLDEKSVAGSLSVKVIVAVWPARREAALEEMETVGRVVSIVIDGESEAAAVLALPAASVNLPAATETVPGAVELGVGVNVAV